MHDSDEQGAGTARTGAPETGTREIAHDRAARRFSLDTGGVRSELDYRLEDGVMTITHTGVPQELGGRGIGSDLAAAAFAAARAEGWRVRPSCTFAAAWARRHPEYADLLE
jgi:uncharacterized protein